MSHDATKNLNEVMRKYDRESNTRAWEGKPKIAVQAYLAAFAVFEVYVTLFGTMLDEAQNMVYRRRFSGGGFPYMPPRRRRFGRRAEGVSPFCTVSEFTLLNFLHKKILKIQILSCNSRFERL